MTRPSELTITNDIGSHDLAIVRTLAAVLEDALARADFATASALAEQLEEEVRRHGARGSQR